jgi:hypothetical protein
VGSTVLYQTLQRLHIAGGILFLQIPSQNGHPNASIQLEHPREDKATTNTNFHFSSQIQQQWFFAAPDKCVLGPEKETNLQHLEELPGEAGRDANGIYYRSMIWASHT